MANIIDSFFIALGFKVDPSGAAEMKKQTDAAKSNLLSLGNAVKAFATGFVVKSIADINSTFEQNRIAIGGFLSALGLSGDFQKGLEDADATIQSITSAAAKLPGEAEEYITVFKAGLPFLAKALPGASIGALTDFTNQFTAIGKTLGVDAEQIGRDLSLMLSPQGRAGAHVKTFQQIVPFLRQVQGQANLTAETFNSMDPGKRVELMRAAFVKLQPMLDESASSFDAMWGAAKSMVKTVVRLATGDLFKGAKAGLDAIRAFFVDDAGKLTANGQGLVNMLKQAGYIVVRMIRMVAGLTAGLIKFVSSSVLAKAGLGALAIAIFGVQKALMFGLIGAIALIAEDLYTFYTGGQSVTGLLVEKFAPALTLIQGALALLGTTFVVVQGKSIAAAVATAAAWAIANLPILIIIASLGVLLYSLNQIIAKWEEFKATVGFWKDLSVGKLKDLVGIGAPEGALSNAGAARLKFGRTLEEIAQNKAFKAMGPNMSPADAAANEARYEGPRLQGTPDAKGLTWERPSFDTKNVNVQQVVNNHITSDRPVEAGREVERGIVRANQKAHAY